MNLKLALLAVLSGCDAPPSVARDPQRDVQDGVQFFADRFAAWTPFGCSYDQNGPGGIAGYEPNGDGKYPLFVYTVGTFGAYDALEGDIIAREMARRGFVAATVDYSDGYNTEGLWLCAPDCSCVNSKAACIYDLKRDDSALAKLCRRPKADCDRGIATAGMSQGASMALMAANFHGKPAAAWVMGGVDLWGSASCVDAGQRTLRADRLRVVDGAEDEFADRDTLVRLTGQSCPGEAHDCLQSDGSGWYAVKDSELTPPRRAGHCYYNTNGCTNQPEFDPGWATPASLPWSLSTNLHWLAAHFVPVPQSQD